MFHQLHLLFLAWIAFLSSVRSYSSVDDLLERSYQRVRRYSSLHHSLESISYVPDLNIKKLSNKELILRRGLTLLIVLTIFGSGILLRLLYVYTANLKTLCVPSNSTLHYQNTTFQICSNVIVHH